jgi:DNA-binding XRE family transcriptional regulator
MSNNLSHDDLNDLIKKPRQRKPKNSVLNNLREILDNRNMTQQELADLTGILPQHLGLIIRNQRKCISLPTAIKIAEALNMQVEEIFTNENK